MNRAVAQDALRCERPCHKKLATFALAVKYYGICHAAGVVQIRLARSQPQVSPASPGHNPNRKKQHTSRFSARLFAVCPIPPPRQPSFAPANQGSTSTGTASQPISIQSSPIVDKGNHPALSPSPTIGRPRPRILCVDSDSDEEGYSTAHPLAPLCDPATLPTTVDPRVLFAFDAADSGDDSASVNMDNEEESDGADLDNEQGTKTVDRETEGSEVADASNNTDNALIISASNNNNVYVISISSSDNDNLDVISISSSDNEASGTANPETPANSNALSSSDIIEDGSTGDGPSSSIVDNSSDSDWGYPGFDDPDLIDAIGCALDDPFGWGAEDGWD